jgi:hypothetical protein
MHNEHHHYEGARMIRRTIATMTLAAVVTIALGSAAPALTASPADPGTAGVCTMETGNASIPSLDLDWNAGGLSGSRSASESEEPKDAKSPRRTPQDAESPTGRGRKDHLC